MSETLELSQYEGQRVIVTRKLEDGTLDEIEGTCQSGNELGLLIKPRGKASVEIIEASDIEQVVFAPEKLKNLSPKYIKEVTYGQARQHLLDRHGYTIGQVNAMTEESALHVHASIDHEANDLGHRHGEKPAKAEATETSDSSDEDED